MKKWLVATVITALISGGAYAQKFQIGVKGGVNISNYTGGNLNTEALVGFHAGGTLHFLLGKNFSITPEVLFSTQGAKYDEVGTEKDIKVNYIQLPVMARYRFDGGFYLEAGPQFGFKVGENTDIPNQTIENFAKDVDISLGAGLGFHGKSGFGIGARYLAGVSKVGDFESTNIDPDFKNSVIQVSLFYTLFNKKN